MVMLFHEANIINDEPEWKKKNGQKKSLPLGLIII